MSTENRVHQLLEIVLSGGNGTAYRELREISAGFLWSIRRQYGFFEIPATEIQGNMLDDVLQEAMLRHKQTGTRFQQCLQNSFRDECRRRKRLARFQNWGDLSASLASGKTVPIINSSPEADETPEIRATKNEAVHKAVSLVRKASPLCQRVLLLFCKGRRDGEIALKLQLSHATVKNTRQGNVRHIRQQMPDDTW
jgi:DNA-directed RNA polymerase specialized sigma24 family protein